MIKKISKIEEFKKESRDNNVVTYLNKSDHISAISSMNKQLEDVRRDYWVKDRNSQITASNAILTTDQR